MLKGLIEGIVFSLAPKNRAAVVDTIMKRLRLSDRAVAEEGYQDVIKSVERKPFTTVEGMRNIQRLMKQRSPAVENLNVEEMLDDRIIRRLDQSGFIDGLYRSYGVK
jgi:hypothetical protein